MSRNMVAIVTSETINISRKLAFPSIAINSINIATINE